MRHDIKRQLHNKNKDYRIRRILHCHCNIRPKNNLPQSKTSKPNISTVIVMNQLCQLTRKAKKSQLIQKSFLKKPEGGICHILHHQKQRYHLPLCQGCHKRSKQLQLSVAEQINNMFYSSLSLKIFHLSHLKDGRKWEDKFALHRIT